MSGELTRFVSQSGNTPAWRGSVTVEEKQATILMRENNKSRINMGTVSEKYAVFSQHTNSWLPTALIITGRARTSSRWTRCSALVYHKMWCTTSWRAHQCGGSHRVTTAPSLHVRDQLHADVILWHSCIESVTLNPRIICGFCSFVNDLRWSDRYGQNLQYVRSLWRGHEFAVSRHHSTLSGTAVHGCSGVKRCERGAMITCVFVSVMPPVAPA